MSEPLIFPPRLEELVRITIRDGKASIAEKSMMAEIERLRARAAELERERDEAVAELLAALEDACAHLRTYNPVIVAERFRPLLDQYGKKP